MRDQKLHAFVARRCAKHVHIPKSKWHKHLSAGTHLEVESLKNCTLLWRKAYLFTSQNAGNIFGLELLAVQVQMFKKCMPLWREAHVEVILILEYF